MSSPASHHLRAIGFALLAFTIWVASDTCYKLACEFGAPIYEIMLTGSIGGAISIFLLSALRGNIARLRPHRPRELLALGVLGFCTIACWLKALPHVPLTGFYTIGYTMPMMIALLAALFLGERLGWQMVATILAGFGGIVVALDPKHLVDSGTWIYYAILLVGITALALQMLLLRVLGKKESRESTVFYPRFVTIIVTIVAGLIWGFPAMPLSAFLYAFGSGLIGALGWFCMAEAYKRAPAATVAPFQYSNIIPGALAGYAIWHNVPSWHLAAGCGIVIATGIYIIRHTQKSAVPEEIHD